MILYFYFDKKMMSVFIIDVFTMKNLFNDYFLI